MVSISVVSEVLKVMLHGTIRKTIFSATQRCNVGTVL